MQAKRGSSYQLQKNFVGRNLFHKKYKTHVHVTAVQIFVHILILFL